MIVRHYEDKTAWGYGPWTDEPDRVFWTEDGVDCLIIRNRFGVLSGYVRADHLEGTSYFDLDVMVHGGLSYDGPRCPDRKPEKEDDEVGYWFGFDCGHAGDLCPAMTPQLGGVYRDLDYVKAEVVSLANQIKGMRRAA